MIMKLKPKQMWLVCLFSKRKRRNYRRRRNYRAKLLLAKFRENEGENV